VVNKDEDDDTQVYKKPWVGLTLKEIQDLAEESHGVFYPIDLTLTLAVEAKLKAKNT
jgi:hypothetical protein